MWFTDFFSQIFNQATGKKLKEQNNIKIQHNNFFVFCQYSGQAPWLKIKKRMTKIIQIWSTLRVGRWKIDFSFWKWFYSQWLFLNQVEGEFKRSNRKPKLLSFESCHTGKKIYVRVPAGSPDQPLTVECGQIFLLACPQLGKKGQHDFIGQLKKLCYQRQRLNTRIQHSPEYTHI